MIPVEEYVIGLRKEMRQVIRMMEDSVYTASDANLYMLVGRLVKIQGTIDELTNMQEEWSNEHE